LLHLFPFPLATTHHYIHFNSLSFETYTWIHHKQASFSKRSSHSNIHNHWKEAQLLVTQFKAKHHISALHHHFSEIWTCSLHLSQFYSCLNIDSTQTIWTFFLHSSIKPQPNISPLLQHHQISSQTNQSNFHQRIQDSK
jgi:hypothetical protein